jgi:hypothetical protein
MGLFKRKKRYTRFGFPMDSLHKRAMKRGRKGRPKGNVTRYL